MEELIKSSLSDIYNTLAKDFIAFHPSSQSPLILRVDDTILTTQSSLRVYDILEILWFGIHKS